MDFFFLAVTLLLPVPAGTPLHSQIAADAAKARGRVGVACSLPGTVLDCNHNSDAKLPMQSVYKLPIGMAALDAIEHGKFTLDTSVRFLPSDSLPPGWHSPLRDAHPHGNVDVSMRELIRLAVSESDGVASDILLRVLGGPAVVDSYIRKLGIDGMRIRDTEKALSRDVRVQYRNYATAAALVSLLRLLADRSPLSPEHTAVLLDWMTVTQTGEHRLKALLPPGTPVAHKTGTSGQHHGITEATNDAGLITLPDGKRLAVAVLVSDSPANESTRESVIAQIGLAIYKAATQSK
jgi:beta-lactamase class A